MHNCYKCKYRANVPGSTHSSCEKITGSYARLLISIVVAQGQPIKGISFNQHGVCNGWCNWPVDFDPCWIIDCVVYEEKQ